MKKLIASVALAFLGIFLIANMASACFFFLYQQALPKK